MKKISEGTREIFEACSFQDLTGQRIGKITRTLSALEGGIREISILAGGKSPPQRAYKDYLTPIVKADTKENS